MIMNSYLIKLFILLLTSISISFASCTIIIRDNSPKNIFSVNSFVRAESSGLGLVIPKCEDNDSSTKMNCSSGLYGTPSRILYTYLIDFRDCKGSVNTNLGLSIGNKRYFLANVKDKNLFQSNSILYLNYPSDFNHI